MSEDRARRARSFGGVAEAYDRGRPTYPADAVRWLVSGTADPQPLTVLELGAGTGKLTAGLLAAGHDVLATDPDESMLEVLRAALPSVPTAVAPAEDVPLPDASVDVVVCGQAFHWFDHTVALPEVARVLRPGGHLSVVWNERDERIPWVRRLGRILAAGAEGADEQHPTGPIEASELFEEVATAGFAFWQAVDRSSILDLARSRSQVAVLPDERREALLAELLALYDDYGRGMDGMQLPYRSSCFRARLRPGPEADDVGAGGDARAGGQARGGEGPLRRDPLTDSADTLPRVVLGHLADDGLVLIDYR